MIGFICIMIKRFNFSMAVLLSIFMVACTPNGSTNSNNSSDDTEYVYLDVRTQEEVNAGAIPGSIHIDIYADDFDTRVAELDKEKNYMVYCKSGGRSSKAVKKMKKMGFYSAFNMSGGYTKWKKQN